MTRKPKVFMNCGKELKRNGTPLIKKFAEGI
jgi:hypothetical protein